MSDPEPAKIPAQKLRALQIVIAAMLMGVVTFLLVAAVVRSTMPAGDQAKDGPELIITWVAVVVAIGSVMAASLLPGMVVRAGRRRLALDISGRDGTDAPDGTAVEAELVKLFSIKTIIGGAALEGAALFAIVAYLVEGNLYAVVAAVALALLLAYHLPTQARAADWLDLQCRALEGNQVDES